MIERMLSGPLVRVTGYNGALNTTDEFIGGASAAWSDANGLWLTPIQVTAVSASANDAEAGTGCQKIRIVGAGPTGELQTEDVTMNGTTPVTTTKTWMCLYGFYGIQFGSGGAAAGIITLLKSGGAALIGSVAAGDNMGFGAVYVVPPGCRYELSGLIIGASTQPAIVSVWVRLALYSAWYKAAMIPVGNVGVYDIELDTGIVLGPLDVIRLDALSTTGAGRVCAVAKLARTSA